MDPLTVAIQLTRAAAFVSLSKQSWDQHLKPPSVYYYQNRWGSGCPQ